MKSTTLIKLTFFLLAVAGTGCKPGQDKLTIATAANCQFAIDSIATNFSKETGIKINLVISSSGKHTAQIIAGAPYDIFISADMKYPQRLYAQGLSEAEPEVYAYGKLVLWSINKTMKTTIDNLIKKDFQHLAVPNPETAPYGIAAREAMIKLNLWEELQDYFVFGESVAQTNQYIVSGAADIGFTAASIVKAPKNQSLGRWVAVSDSLYRPITQGVVILKSTTKPDEAQRFYQYLFSENSKKVLTSFGYKVDIDR